MPVRNEKGVTLIELLGVLVILSLLFTFLGAILVNSLKTSDRATTEQRLQQEANYITEKVRNAFLKQGKDQVVLKIDGDTLTMVNRIDNVDGEEEQLSTGYLYDCSGENCKENEETNIIEIIIEKNTENKAHRQLVLTLSTNNQVHEINTVFSKLK